MTNDMKPKTLTMNAAVSAKEQEPPETLSAAEQTQYRAAEKIISREFSSDVDVGEALTKVRDNKLYRAEYSTFEQYVQRRWKMARSHPYRLIDAARVTHVLAPVGGIQPISESQVRALTTLTDEDVIRAWQAAVIAANGQSPTAGAVAKAAAVYKDTKQNPPKRSRLSSALKLALDQIRSVLGDAHQALTQCLPHAEILPLQNRAIELVDTVRSGDGATIVSGPANGKLENANIMEKSTDENAPNNKSAAPESAANGQSDAPKPEKEFVVVLWDGEDPEPERFYDEERFPDIALLCLWPGMESPQKGWPEQDALFVVEVELSDRDSMQSPFCKPQFWFLSLSTGGAVPTPVKVPDQLVKGGWAGVVKLIEKCWPNARKIIASGGLPLEEVPKGWERDPLK